MRRSKTDQTVAGICSKEVNPNPQNEDRAMLEKPITKTEEIITKLREYSKETFYLTGSQFYGKANDSSDWDYFVQDSDETRKFLFSLGFRVIPKSATNMSKNYDYTDTDCLGVMRHKQAAIDVQFSANVKIRLVMRRIMHCYGDKFDHAEWMQAYLCAKYAYEIAK